MSVPGIGIRRSGQCSGVLSMFDRAGPSRSCGSTPTPECFGTPVADGFSMTQKVRGPLFDQPKLMRTFAFELDQLGRNVTSELKRYPTQQRGKRHTFRSDRERRGFFFHLRRGDIKVPYRRTRNLARAWSSNVRVTPGGEYTLEIGLNTDMAPYGHFVEGLKTGPESQRQTRDMEERGWPSIETVLLKQRANAIPRLKKVMTG